MDFSVTSVTASRNDMNFSKRNCESEKTLEARLVDEVKKRGGVALKLTSQFHRGMPDRLVLLPFHTLAFVEMKSTGQKPSALQEVAIALLRSMRFTVRVIDCTADLDGLLQTLDDRLEEQRLYDAELKAKRHTLKKAYLKEKKDERMTRRFKSEIEKEDVE